MSETDRSEFTAQEISIQCDLSNTDQNESENSLQRFNGGIFEPYCKKKHSKNKQSNFYKISYLITRLIIWMTHH